ncbi:2,4,5-trihydroxytoluene oxygenase [Burkholderia sp. USMB20]|nr:2,4,5-trihydroxytoluene oxygenase [Burkholderia sp. USMB20]
MMTARDILYVRYALPDLVAAERFMTDFGLSTVQRTDEVLRMRAAAAAPFVYEAVRGAEGRFLGVGFCVPEQKDLVRLASFADAGPIEALPSPFRGEYVRLTMPDGFQMDAVWSEEVYVAAPVRAPNRFNAGHAKERTNASIRQRREPAPALRLGHVTLHVTDHAASVAWLRERFGLVPSDYFGPEPGRIEDVVGTFLRVDRGADFVDHHCLLVLQSRNAGIHHSSFELQDLDHVMSAHDYLSLRGYRLDCGVGRHMLGSQIYDYWRDVHGFRVEHYTDGDVVNRDHVPSVFCGGADETTQWGMAPGAEFFE